jgi:dolichol-phosphate mannosyltransferase
VAAVLFRILLAAQAVAAMVLIARLARGRTRDEPVHLEAGGAGPPDATIAVPVLNEARRLTPLLGALPAQRARVREILVVDSGSADGTREIVGAATDTDPRIRLVSDPPLPDGWVGKAWALEHARSIAAGDWLVFLDADIRPEPDAVAAALSAAEARNLDVASFSPSFAGQSFLERFLHPSILTTLVYRTGPPATGSPPNQVLANGQFFLARASVLARHGGYAPVRGSFSEDVSLARHLARHGARVGFLDGRRLFSVRSYTSASEMWREWGRSVDLRDATAPVRQALDLAFLFLVQALPLPLLAAAALGCPVPVLLVWLSLTLVAVRFGLSAAIAPSYENRGLPFWLSPLADPIAVLRVALSSVRRPTAWRGRAYKRREV